MTRLRIRSSTFKYRSAPFTSGRTFGFLWGGVLLLGLSSCSDTDGTEDIYSDGSGGTQAMSGGVTGSGAMPGSGGGQPGGGTPGSGGLPGSGGAPATGGLSSGGAGGSPNASTGGSNPGSGGGSTDSGGGTGSGGQNSQGCEATGFHIQGSKILDVNCNEFVMRGVNVPHAWYTGNTQQAFSDIAMVGGNSVRVVMATGGQWSRTSGADVSSIISWAKSNQLVAVLEVHDSTGYGDSANAVHPDQAVEYWKSNDILSAISGEEAYVMINIANEPFGNSGDLTQDADTWRNFHVGAVQELRAAGITHTLVVDAPNWGQDWQNIMRDGTAPQAVFDADPQKNTVFSVHMYDIYSSQSVVTGYFDAFLGSGLPLIVGEFAADHGTGIDVDEATIMAQAGSRGLGYLGWSWSGNSSDLASLDMTNNFNLNSLTSWGTTIINSETGIALTSQTCSCFN